MRRTINDHRPTSTAFRRDINDVDRRTECFINWNRNSYVRDAVEQQRSSCHGDTAELAVARADEPAIVNLSENATCVRLNLMRTTTLTCDVDDRPNADTHESMTTRWRSLVVVRRQTSTFQTGYKVDSVRHPVDVEHGKTTAARLSSYTPVMLVQTNGLFRAEEYSDLRSSVMSQAIASARSSSLHTHKQTRTRGRWYYDRVKETAERPIDEVE